MSESPVSSASHDCFINKSERLEIMARSVEGSVDRDLGGWETYADDCRLRPYTAMARIAAYLCMYPSTKSIASYAIFILDCTRKPDKSLDEIYDAGKQKDFLDLFQRLEELYQSTNFQD